MNEEIKTSRLHNKNVVIIGGSRGLGRAIVAAASAEGARVLAVARQEQPLTYLTRWRMSRAIRLLKDNVEIEKIAELLGYESAVAFHKAFKREVGKTPAKYRKLG